MDKAHQWSVHIEFKEKLHLKLKLPILYYKYPEANCLRNSKMAITILVGQAFLLNLLIKHAWSITQELLSRAIKI